MKGDTAFIKNGRDIFSESTGVKWWFPLLVFLYTALLFGQWVTMQNVTVAHTRFVNPGAPGELYSLRYSSFQAITLQVLGTRIFLILAVLALMALRRSYTWNLIMIVFIGILVAMQTFVFVALTYEYITHSRDGQRFALSTDRWFCCAPERHANALNGCINVLPCEAPVPAGFTAADLRANEPFVALYWVNLVLFLLDAVWIVWLMWMWNAPVSAFQLDGGAREKTDDDDMRPSAPLGDDEGNVLAKVTVKQNHGLRQRVK